MIWEEISTGRMILRAPTRFDTGAIALYCADPRVAQMTTSIPHPYLSEMAETFVRQVLAGRHRDLVWVMDVSPSGGAEMAGLISYKRDKAEIGYWVGPPFWGTGLATDALRAVADWLQARAGVEDLRATVFFDNAAGQQVLANAGFERVGETWLHSVARGAEVPTLVFRRAPLTGADTQARDRV